MTLSRTTSLLLGVLALTAVPAGAWEEKPLTVTEGRGAAAVIEDQNLRGLARVKVGNRSIGAPPRVVPLREACVEVVDRRRRLIDFVCAPANVFIDDLFTYGEGAGTLDSIVKNEFGLEVARSTITFAGTWARDVATCNAATSEYIVNVPVGTNVYAGGPVFPVAEAEAETQCAAEVAFSITSKHLGTPAGTPAGIIGVNAGEAWRGAKQDLP